MDFKRSSGVLLHPTSLPGRYGVGDLGGEAYRFVDWLAEAGQTYWQIMPLGPTGYGDSPYSAFSAFAGNPLLVSPERLVGDRLLSDEDLGAAPEFPASRVDYGRAIEYKRALLEQAFREFRRQEGGELRGDYEGFLGFAAGWLDDYALFGALRDARSGASWHTWKAELARRDEAAVAAAREQLRERVEAHKFFQFLFFKQWLE